MSGMKRKTEQDNVIFPKEINYSEIQMILVSVSKEQNLSLCNMLKKAFFIQVQNNSESIQPGSLFAYRAASGPLKGYRPPWK